ncbi:hypothetical protein TspCOW1_30210 [Thiohalobacter sp. COW1]|uniref:DUF4382 domain-containing protein n=1 Tax=Thiohalobacter sp. COW1 TaxID=2795687 RepID=UPI0019159F17|nr:DUF4382 domain-containing protein [Thiohalobacter sp. COW1]BCO32918.1 hypothetical protein TspCOW1_30210 [Thiohalobacter sp. COW1]
MNPTTTHFHRTLLAGLVAVGLSACGGGGGSDSGGTGSFSLSITDAPVDDVTEVVVTFTAVTLKPADGDAITITLDTPQSINLLDYQNGASVTLVDDEAVTAGDYAWIRLELDQDNTYIVDGTGQHDLTIPSSAQTGLKLNNSFTLSADQTLAYTIDFNLRQSVHLTGAGDYIMRPTLRMVKDDEAGTLAGSADSSLFPALCASPAAVYVFEEGDSVDDMDGDDGDPVATVNLPMDGVNDYTVSPLDPGVYTVALACGSDQDTAEDGDPGTDDDNYGETGDADDMSFYGETSVTIMAGETTTHDFN